MTSLRDLRSRAGLKQVELARLCGCHPTTVNRWENGGLSAPGYAWTICLTWSLLDEGQRAQVMETVEQP